MLSLAGLDLLAAPSVDSYPIAWLKALSFTWAVEVSLGVWLLRAHVTLHRRLGLLFLGSALTHPCVWFVFPFIGLDFIPAMILAEIFAVVVEAAVYAVGAPGLRPLRALAISFALNSASLGLGLLVRELTGWV